MTASLGSQQYGDAKTSMPILKDNESHIASFILFVWLVGALKSQKWFHNWRLQVWFSHSIIPFVIKWWNNIIEKATGLKVEHQQTWMDVIHLGIVHKRTHQHKLLPTIVK